MGCLALQGELLLCGGTNPRRCKNGYHLANTETSGKASGWPEKEGLHLIEKAYTGADTLKICREFQPDVIVLDIMLPDIDGLEVCKLIRAFSYCSILFLSSRNDDVDKILGFSCGGDDYITKPFSPREVVFRVKAQLRRQQYQTASPIFEKSSG